MSVKITRTRKATKSTAIPAADKPKSTRQIVALVKRKPRTIGDLGITQSRAVVLQNKGIIARIPDPSDKSGFKTRRQAGRGRPSLLFQAGPKADAPVSGKIAVPAATAAKANKPASKPVKRVVRRKKAAAKPVQNTAAAA